LALCTGARAYRLNCGTNGKKGGKMENLGEKKPLRRQHEGEQRPKPPNHAVWGEERKAITGAVGGGREKKTKKGTIPKTRSGVWGDRQKKRKAREVLPSTSKKELGRQCAPTPPPGTTHVDEGGRQNKDFRVENNRGGFQKEKAFLGKESQPAVVAD